MPMKTWTRRIAGAAASVVAAAGLMLPVEATATPFGQNECWTWEMDPSLQECVVWSNSMNKHIWVHVRPSATPGNDKVAMFLDGIQPSGHINDWIIQGDAPKRLADKDATLVFPGATDNHYYAVDYANGSLKYDTFFSQEIPAFLEAQFGIPRGGHGTTGLAGFSMGAYGAMNLAAKHPDRYNTVLALSGFYDNQGPARAMEAITGFWQGFEGRGNSTDPLEAATALSSGKWKGFNSPWQNEEQRAADSPMLNLKNLTMPVIVSSSTGVTNFAGDLTENPAAVIFQGGIIEAGTFMMTKEMEAATTAAGMKNFYYHYDPVGSHAWDTWKRHAFDQGLMDMFFKNLFTGDGNPADVTSNMVGSSEAGYANYGGLGSSN